MWSVHVCNTFLHIEVKDGQNSKKISTQRTRSCPPFGTEQRLIGQKPHIWPAPSSQCFPQSQWLADDARKLAPSTTLRRLGLGLGLARCDEDECYGDEEGPTTMMIRNIPCRCTREDVIADINELGYAGTFDFFYIPQDRRGKTNLGYAFINFKNPVVAASFQEGTQGHRFTCRSRAISKSKKTCVVAPATIQGLESNLEHFRRTRLLQECVGGKSPESRHSGMLTDDSDVLVC